VTARLHALVVADGEVPSRAALDDPWPGWDDAVSLVIAADGGALRAAAIGLTPVVVVGDLDSLDEAELARLERSGIPIERASVDKDESDAELAVLAAIARGADRITVLGAFGGPRFDHALANVWLLSHPALRGRDACLLDARVRIRLLDATAGPARATLEGRAGDLVTLLPFAGAASGITTSALRYPLSGETLEPGPARGLSNVRLGEVATVELQGGRLLIVEVPGG
jgi:thiamine pyrophosphokinase